MSTKQKINNKIRVNMIKQHKTTIIKKQHYDITQIPNQTYHLPLEDAMT